MKLTVLDQAIERYKRIHNGVEVTIHQMPIPGFWGTFGESVLQAATERAVENGLTDVILTWEDMPCSVCFQDGYCFVVAVSEETAEASRGTHYFDQKDFLCKMGEDGEIYKEEPDQVEDIDSNPFHGDFSTYEGPWAV
jgi:hypothetical protein